MKLIKPSIKYQASYLSYIEELGDEERYPFPLDFDHRDFPAMLARFKTLNKALIYLQAMSPAQPIGWWMVMKSLAFQIYAIT